MANQEFKKFRGLNTRTNNMFKPSDFATDCRNVHLDGEGRLVKRFGYDLLSAESGFIQLFSYADRKLKQKFLLGLKSDGLYKWNGTTWDLQPFGFDEVRRPISFDNKVNYTVFDGVLYFVDPEKVNPMMKYDGRIVSRAGFPQPTTQVTFSGSFPSRDIYYCAIIETRDEQDNYVLTQVSNIHRETTVATTQYILVRFNNDPRSGFDNLENRFFYSLNDPSLLTEKVLVRVYVSENPNFGWKLLKEEYENPHIGYYDFDALGTEIDNALLNGDNLSDIYDITYTKRIPPYAGTITSFGSNIVLGDVVDPYERPSGFTAVTDRFPNAVRWSDISTGGSPESFPALNQAQLGSNVSEVTGVFGGQNGVVGFKEDNALYLAGNLFTGNYLVRDTLSEGIGCVSHRSIVKVEGGCIFMTDRGLYYTTDGLKPIEFSDVIEPTLRDPDLILSESESVLDFKNEKILIHIPRVSEGPLIVEYDFYHKEWFLHDKIDGTGGFVIHDGNLYHSDGTNVYVRSSSFNDDGEPIAAYYSTSWLVGSSPALEAKFPKVQFGSLSTIPWELKVKTEYDWKEGDYSEEGTLDFNLEEGKIFRDMGLEASKCNSMRITFSNEEVDQPIVINAMHLDVEETGTEFKGDE